MLEDLRHAAVFAFSSITDLADKIITGMMWAIVYSLLVVVRPVLGQFKFPSRDDLVFTSVFFLLIAMLLHKPSTMYIHCWLQDNLIGSHDQEGRHGYAGPPLPVFWARGDSGPKMVDWRGESGR